MDRKDTKTSLFDDSCDDAEVNGLVPTQLITYIEDVRSDTTFIPVFKLLDLVKLYSDWLCQLGISADAVCRPHSYRLNSVFFLTLLIFKLRNKIGTLF